MREQRPDTGMEVATRLLINVVAVGLLVGLVTLVVVTIIHEAG